MLSFVINTFQELPNIQDFFNFSILKNDVSKLQDFANFANEYISFVQLYDINYIKNKDAKIFIPNRKDFVFLTNFYDADKVISLNNHYYHIDIDEMLRNAKQIKYHS